MQLKFKIEMLLSEPSQENLRLCIAFCIVCPFVLSSFGYS